MNGDQVKPKSSPCETIHSPEFETMKTFKHSHLVLIAICVLSLVLPLRAQTPTVNVLAPAQLNLMPVPASVQIQTGRLPINSSFNVAVKNYTDDRLRAGIDRMLSISLKALREESLRQPRTIAATIIRTAPVTATTTAIGGGEPKCSGEFQPKGSRSRMLR